MVVSLLVLAGAACSLKPGMSLRRTVDVPGTAAGWHDVTDHLVAALPPVPSALATVRAPSGSAPVWVAQVNTKHRAVRIGELGTPVLPPCRVSASTRVTTNGEAELFFVLGRPLPA